MSEDKDKNVIQIPMFSKETKGKLVYIPLNQLPANDAEGMESTPPAPDFIQDIAERGLLDPIIVVKNDQGYKVIAGRRRVKAFRYIHEEMALDKFDKIKAVIYESMNDYDALLAASAHNNRRSDNIITDILAIKAVLDTKPTASKSSIAKLTGIPISRVAKRMDLFNLDATLYTALADGEITNSVAEKVAKMPEVLQKELAEKFIKNGKLSMKDVEDVRRTLVQDTVDTNLVLPDFEPVDETIGFVLMDLNVGSIMGHVGDLGQIKQDRKQYEKDYPDIKLTICKVVKTVE